MKIRLTAKENQIVEADDLCSAIEKSLLEKTGLAFSVDCQEVNAGSWSDDITFNITPPESHSMDDDHEPSDEYGFIQD